MRTTILAWAVILALQILLVTFFFRPIVEESIMAIYAVTMALQGYQIMLRSSWLRFLTRWLSGT